MGPQLDNLMAPPKVLSTVMLMESLRVASRVLLLEKQSVLLLLLLFGNNPRATGRKYN